MKNTKKICAFALVALALIACLCFALPQKALAKTEGVFTYFVLDGEAKITGCTNPVGDVEIPATTLDGVPVTSIGDSAFSDCTGLTSITIPSSVTSIGYGAFAFCTDLTSITVDSGNTVYHSAGNCLIETASKSLVFGCQNSVIPSDGSVTEIGSFAFYGCTGLTSISIPDSVTSIGADSFYGCSGLVSITVDSGNTVYHSAGNCLIETASKSLVLGCQNSVIPSDGSVTEIGLFAFYGCTGLTSIVIPNSVTSIREYAFASCTGLTSIAIPEGVTAIRYSAFEGCSGLASVTIPDSVTSIGVHAFVGCTSLTSIAIPDSVTSIYEFAFAGCTSLTSITVPKNVTSIGDYAFAGCDLLSSITVDPANTVYHSAGNCLIETASKTLIVGCQNSVIPSDGSVTSIGAYAFEYAFEDCNGLTSITIPSSVTSIGEYAFYGCSGLTSITIPDSVTSIGGFTFKGCTSLTSITIPNGVTSIGEEAFEGCTGLSSVTLSEGLTDLYAHAFLGCTSLTSITLPDSLSSIDLHVFAECTSLSSITIPEKVTYIGFGSFYDCTNLTKVTLKGPAPYIENAVFGNITATVYYPNDGTYTEKVRQNYDGNLTWVEYDPNANTVYEIKEGAKVEWAKDSDKELAISSAADFGKFVAVKVDGEIVSPENYTVKSGSTIVTFKPEYLATLSEGEHTFTIVSLDGEANTVLTVQTTAAQTPAPATEQGSTPAKATADTKAPQTGDDNHLVLWALLAVLSLAGAGFSAKRIFAK